MGNERVTSCYCPVIGSATFNEIRLLHITQRQRFFIDAHATFHYCCCWFPGAVVSTIIDYKLFIFWKWRLVIRRTNNKNKFPFSVTVRHRLSGLSIQACKHLNSNANTNAHTHTCDMCVYQCIAIAHKDTTHRPPIHHRGCFNGASKSGRVEIKRPPALSPPLRRWLVAVAVVWSVRRREWGTFDWFLFLFQLQLMCLCKYRTKWLL
jgi:hypothetical protein